MAIENKECPKFFWSLSGIVLLAWALRFLAAFYQPHPDYYMHADSAYYWKDAGLIIKNFTIAPYLYPSGFPLFLAFFRLLGMENPFFFVLWIQPLIGAGTVALLAWFIARKTRPWMGLLAGAILALNPQNLNLARQLLTETTYTFFLLLSFVLLDTCKNKRLFLAGLFWGICGQMRILTFVAVPFIFTPLLFFKKFRLPLLCFLIGLCTILFLGLTLNYRSTQTWKLTSNQHKFIADYVPVLGGYRYRTAEEIEERGDYYSMALRKPLLFTKERFINIVNFFCPWTFGKERSLSNKVLIFADVLILAPFFLLLILNLKKIPALPPVYLSMFITLFIMAGMYIAIITQPRYRMPFFPLMLCLSAYWLAGYLQNAEKNSD